MESKQMGGGVLACVAVAIPALTQAMDLKIAQPVGFAGLAICAVLFLLGIALVVVPKREPQRQPYRGWTAEGLGNLERAITGAAEKKQRSELLARLTQLYLASHDGISPALMAGLELPPQDWLNDQLESLGERWRIGAITGSNATTYKLEDGATEAPSTDP